MNGGILMRTRVISGLAMVPLLLVVYFGGYWLIAATLIVSVIGIKEFYNGFRQMGIEPSLKLGYAAIALLYGLHCYMYYMGDFNNIFVLAWLVLVIMAGSLYMFDLEKRKPEDAMATMTGIIYVVFFAFHVVLVDEIDNFSIMKWLILLTAFGSDIFAYFSGMLFGRHKLCPELSPKKTIEGAVGGVLGSVLLSALFGFLASPVSMLGDLTASAYKRKMGIKDYGDLIPGHGGIMDRFDSVLFTAPFVYYYVMIVMRYFMGL